MPVLSMQAADRSPSSYRGVNPSAMRRVLRFWILSSAVAVTAGAGGLPYEGSAETLTGLGGAEVELQDGDQYSQMLRAVGWFMTNPTSLPSNRPADEDSSIAPEETAIVRDFELVNYGEYLAFSWLAGVGASAKHAYAELTKSELCDQIRTLRGLRGHAADQPSGEHEELLRTLGQELDRASVRMIAIFEREREFLVTSSSPTEHLHRAYSKGTLRNLSEQRQSLRVEPMKGPALSARRRKWFSWWRSV
jgi:hypothetical protein